MYKHFSALINSIYQQIEASPCFWERMVNFDEFKKKSVVQTVAPSSIFLFLVPINIV